MKNLMAPSRRLHALVSFVAGVAFAVSSVFAGEAFAGDSREGDPIGATALLQGGFGFIHPKLSRGALG
jgi:hypothetical protein